MMLLKINKNLLTTLMIAVALFFPVMLIHYYYVLMIGLVLLLFVLNEFKLTKNEVNLVSLFFVFVIFLFFYRYIIIGVSHIDFRDPIEYGRLFLILFLLLFFLKAKVDESAFFNILKIYIFVDFLLSTLQYLKFSSPIISKLTYLYSSEAQIESSLGISYRALGLSSDPSAHGLMVLVVISMLSVKYFWIDNKFSYSTLMAIFLGIFTVLLSQSQTAFIGLVLFILMLFFSLIYYQSSSVSSKRNFIFIIIFFTALSYALVFLFSNLTYLMTLFSFGLERSSYIAREDKVIYLLDFSLSSYPFAIISGYGKEFFGTYSTSMDNEHLYILLVWGVFFYMAFIVALISSIYIYLKKKTPYALLFSIPVIIGIPLAWPSAYYLAPKISLLLIISYTLYFYKLKELR